MSEVESLFIVAFYTTGFAFLLELGGLLWALPGGLICGLIARLRRLPAGPYISAGAGYSAVLFFPWVYLFVRMATGKSPPLFLVAPFYVLVYAIWLILWIGSFYVGMLVHSVHDIFVAHTLSLADNIVTIILSLILILLNLLTVWISLKGLLTTYRANRSHPQESATYLPDIAYLMPFIWLIVWGLLNAVVFFIILYISFSG